MQQKMGGDAESIGGLRSRLKAVEHMREGLQILDEQFRYVYLNPAAAAHGQRDRAELIGRKLTEMYPGVEDTEMFKRLSRCLQERVADGMLNLFSLPDGSSRWFELRMQPVPEGVVVLSIDVDRQKRLEEQLGHAQRMEAVGRLAGGIAHDFNNILTIIQTYASFLQSQATSPGAGQDARNILDAAARGAGLTRQLMAISRRQAARPVVLDVDAVIADLKPMLARLVGEKVELVLACGCAGRLRIGAGQLDQVLLNLAANACDAMPEGGRLVIRTDQTRIDEDYADTHLDVAPGVYALVTVSDTGVGIPPEIQSKIFEPFFTTKGPASGTGLGLATSHGIVKQAGGHIWVYSEPGNGTTFKIYFPLVDAPATDLGTRRRSEPTELSGTETILVVDDEPGVVALCTRILSNLGYTVLGAEGPDEGVRFAKNYSGRIHAVLTDLMMPGLNGPELVTRLRESRPGLPMLYMSGYVDDARIVALNHSTYIEKPFMPDELARKLRQVLQP